MSSPWIHTVKKRSDSAGRTVAINGVGNRTTTLYDDASRPNVTINCLGVRTTRVSDLLDRPTGLVDGNNQRTTFGYDAVGNKVALSLRDRKRDQQKRVGDQ